MVERHMQQNPYFHHVGGAQDMVAAEGFVAFSTWGLAGTLHNETGTLIHIVGQS